MSAIFSFLIRIMNVIWELLSISQNTIKNKFLVYIKTSTGGTVPINLDPKWDIKTLKKNLAPKLGLDPEQVKIILAGKELSDATIIKECDLGEQSILHVVKTRGGLEKIENTTINEELWVTGSKPLCETLLDFEYLSSDRDDSQIIDGKNKKAHFYVYCPTCKSLKTGKLRVRCNYCKSGAFTVHDDPQSWDDVLIQKRITGTCENDVNVCSSKLQNEEPSFAEFYFKCSEHQTQGENDEAVPLDLIRPNLKELECLACSDVSDPVFVYPCLVSHVTCIDCFIQYCTSRLRDRQFLHNTDIGYTLGCPVGCDNSLIKEIHHFRLMTDAQYIQYQRFAAEEYVLQNGGVLCPQPNCGMGILGDLECNKITCSNCGFVFCQLCLQGYHIGECVSDEQLDKNNRCANVSSSLHFAEPKWEEASKRTIKILTKPCPRCRTPTERDGGCMHMMCARAGCGFHWCWVCQTEWTRDCMGSHWFG